LSSEVETIHLLSGKNVMQHTWLVWSLNDATSRPVLEFQTLTVLLSPPSSGQRISAIHFPSGEPAQLDVLWGKNATARAVFMCCFEGPDSRSPVFEFQTQASKSADIEMILFPSGENTTKKNSARVRFPSQQNPST
jgi:hypothetical protein